MYFFTHLLNIEFYTPKYSEHSEPIQNFFTTWEKSTFQKKKIWKWRCLSLEKNKTKIICICLVFSEEVPDLLLVYLEVAGPHKELLVHWPGYVAEKLHSYFKGTLKATEHSKIEKIYVWQNTFFHFRYALFSPFKQ